jgi:uncharacterized membrane protein
VAALLAITGLRRLMGFEDVMETVVRTFEVTGVVLLAAGSIVSLGGAALARRREGSAKAFESARRNLGRSILLGLEVLIIADIVTTITIDQTVESALSLGLIVVVRTFLSFSLEIELEGVVPWRRQQRSSET